MVELVIASGKGGTGKTSIVGSLAVLAEKAILVDCDVDAANLHLIINHSTLEEHDFSSSSRASIIKEKCNLCGICEEKCSFDAINLITEAFKTHYRVDPFACEGCGLCFRICPEDAIAFENVISGKWYRSDSEIGPFLHARLGIAESNSGKLVSVLRQKAREIFEQMHSDYIIIDGPPGVGCPVIASITGASYLLIVAEPSLSAIHDMKRLADLARHFRIKTGVCINKYDINRELTAKIEAYAVENDIDIHGRIPFDPVFIEAQIKGKPYFAIANNEGRQAIRDIWENVNEKLKSIKNGLLNKKAV